MRKLVILLVLVAVPCFADDRASEWGYSGDKGPEHWGNLNPAWKVCAVGTRQSPLDLGTFDGLNNNMSFLTFLGNESAFRVQNTGHELKVTVSDEWKLRWNNIDATLLQFHFHFPAEHKYQGRKSAGEIHFVYQLPGNRFLVFAVFIEKGNTASDALAKIIAAKPPQTPTSKLSMGGFLNNPQHYATYDGSLTTPPCSENVTFIISLEGITATEAQIAALKVGGDNARPLQKRNDRGVIWRQSP